MQDLSLFIQSNTDLCYLLVFLWTALEGETFVVFVALAAQKGLLDGRLLFLSAWLGSFCGDQIFFFLGRRFGTHILERFPKFKKRISRSLAWLERHSVAFILSYRFMYGIRNVSGIAVGMSHLPWKKFLIWNLTAAFIWAAAFTGFGYFFGEFVEHVNQKNDVLQQSVHQVSLSMLGLFLLIVGFRVLVSKLHKKKI